MKGVLEEEGILCEIRNETIYRIMPGAAFRPEVWVREEDYAQACEVIDGWSQSQTTSRKVANKPKRQAPHWASILFLIVCWLSSPLFCCRFGVTESCGEILSLTGR